LENGGMSLPEHNPKDIFAEALRLANPAERQAYLDQACAGDQALRQEVESLLSAHDRAGDFLNHTNPLPASDSLMEPTGTMIGRYKLLQKIGEGGFGVVYMAEQVEPVQRKVALKIIKAGMDSKEVIARFEAERQALALMDHPGIANILDAGATEAGRPYFVMELVNGIPITDYCDRKKLPTAERLHLFMKVCHAVQHAHQKGIIHRDLKPTNVLVTLHDGEPVPKVIDFGVVKALGQKLTQKTLFTGFQHLVGTPAYMSPEQAELSGLDVDTRSDIYSLGVLLYELLTGMTPFDKETLAEAAFDEMRRMIRETEPPKPSTRLNTLSQDALGTVARHRQAEPAALSRLVRGDLDWIVMKCLEKDRGRRYETANNVALDIEHHLQHEPVSAAAPSALYLAQKFIRRHKAGLAMAGALVLLLAAGVVVSTWQAVRATLAEGRERAQRQRAEANEKKAETEAARSAQVAQFMKDMLKGVGPSVALGQDTKMLRGILDRTAERLGKDLTNQPAVEVELRIALTDVYWELALYQEMEQMSREVIRISRARLGGDRRVVADGLDQLGRALRKLRKPEEAERVTREALALRIDLYGNEHRDVARSLQSLGVILGSRTKAESVFRKAAAIHRQLSGDESEDLADTLSCLAGVLRVQNRLAEAEAICREVLQMRRKLHGPEHPYVAISLSALGLVRRSQGDLAEAEVCFREALAIRRKVLGEEHPDTRGSVSTLASVLVAEGKVSEAEGVHREALAVRKELLGEEHVDVARTRVELARLMRGQGRLAEAESALTEATRVLDKAAPGSPKDTLLRQEQAGSHRLLGVIFASQKRFDDAERQYRTAIGLNAALAVDFPENWGYFHDVVNLCRALADLPQKAGRPGNANWQSAIAFCEKAIANQRKAGEDLGLAATLCGVSFLYREAGKLSEAESTAREGLAIRRKVLGNEHLDVADALHNLGWDLHLRGKDAEAEAVSREELALYRKLRGTNDASVASCLQDLSQFLHAQRKLTEAEGAIRECITIRLKQFGPSQPDLPNDYYLLNDFLRAQGKLGEVEAVWRQALAVRRKILGNEHPEVGMMLFNLTWVLCDQKKFPEAETQAREAIALFKRLVQKDPRKRDYPEQLGHSQWRLADALLALGRREEAERVLREASQVFADAVTNFPNVAFLHQEHGYSAWQLAGMLERGGQLDAAEAEYRHAIALHEKAMADFPKQGVFTERLTTLKVRLFDLLRREGRLAEAEPIFREAAEHANGQTLNELAWQLATGSDPRLRDGPKAVALAEKAVAGTNRTNPMIMDTLAAAYAEAGQFTNAVCVQQEAIALLQNEQQKKDYASRLTLYESGIPYRNPALLAQQSTALVANGKFAEADPLARECLAIRERQNPDDWLTFNARSLLGGSLLGQKKHAEAEPLLLAAYEGMKQREARIPTNGRPRLKETLQRLVQLYDATGRPDQTAEWKQKLSEFTKAESEKLPGEPPR
jgi:eukaryotic-like serine/threonine-protein kinase